MYLFLLAPEWSSIPKLLVATLWLLELLQDCQESIPNPYRRGETTAVPSHCNKSGTMVDLLLEETTYRAPCVH